MFTVSGEFKIETFKYNTTVVAPSQKSGKFTNSKLSSLNCFEFTISIPKFKIYEKEKIPIIELFDGNIRRVIRGKLGIKHEPISGLPLYNPIHSI